MSPPRSRATDRSSRANFFDEGGGRAPRACPLRHRRRRGARDTGATTSTPAPSASVLEILLHRRGAATSRCASPGRRRRARSSRAASLRAGRRAIPEAAHRPITTVPSPDRRWDEVGSFGRSCAGESDRLRRTVSVRTGSDAERRTWSGRQSVVARISSSPGDVRSRPSEDVDTAPRLCIRRCRR